MRERGLAGKTDFVAVPASAPQIAAAQERFPVVERDGVVGTGQDPSLAALNVEVARSVDGDGWKRLRAKARRTGVNVVLVRLATDDSGVVAG